MALTDEQMIERLRGIYEAFNRADWDAAMEFAHPEVVLVRVGEQPDLHGTDALRAWLEPDAFDSQALDPLEFRVEGNRVLALVHTRARGAGSGIEMEIDAWTVWTFGEDGSVTRIQIFLHHEEDDARRALGGD